MCQTASVSQFLTATCAIEMRLLFPLRHGAAMRLFSNCFRNPLSCVSSESRLKVNAATKNRQRRSESGKYRFLATHVVVQLWTLPFCRLYLDAFEFERVRRIVAHRIEHGDQR